MNRLRVGLNLLFLVPGAGGIGRLSLELAAALAARDDIDLEIFHHRDAPPELFAIPNATRIRFTEVTAKPTTSRGHLIAQYARLPLIAMRRRLDVLHSPAMTGPVLIPGVACAISVHDVIWRQALDDWGDAAARRALDRVTVPTAHLADWILTGTEIAAREVCEELNLSPHRVTVVSNGARYERSARVTPSEVIRDKWDLGQAPILLCVAQKLGYKNQEVLLRALATLPEEDVILVLPGAPTPYERRLRALSHDLGLEHRVRFPEWVSDEELEGLYAIASAVLLPSRFEGFGLPVIEAMARGVPVLCSATSALGEVGGSAALTADPEDTAAWARGIARLLHEPALREHLSSAGRARAAEFTWERAADRSVRAYRNAISERRGRWRRSVRWLGPRGRWR